MQKAECRMQKLAPRFWKQSHPCPSVSSVVIPWFHGAWEVPFQGLSPAAAEPVAQPLLWITFAGQKRPFPMMKPPALAIASSEAVTPSAAVLGACFKNRPVRGPGLQWGQNRRVSCRPRALTRRFRGFSKQALCLLLFTGCASAPRSMNPAPAAAPSSSLSAMIGVASYYGKEYQGKKTASGEIYDMNKMTAAHRTLPFGANVRVTDLSSDRSVVVRVNDRGPFARGRIIDLSLAAARKLDMLCAGKATVKLEIAASAAESAEVNLSSGKASP